MLAQKLKVPPLARPLVPQPHRMEKARSGLLADVLHVPRDAIFGTLGAWLRFATLVTLRADVHDRQSRTWSEGSTTWDRLTLFLDVRV